MLVRRPPLTGLRPQVAVGVFVFDHRRRLLLVQRGRDPGAGLWTIPGGRVEFGETLVAACRREVQEETGLAVDLVDFVTVFERLDGEYHYVIIDYCATVPAPSPQPRAGDDAAAVRWVDTADLGGYALTDGLPEVVPEALRLAEQAGTFMR